jgi:hypothetical protein
MGCIWPFDFMLGGKSLEMNKSEPPPRLIAVNNLTMVDLACSSVNVDIVFPLGVAPRLDAAMRYQQCRIPTLDLRAFPARGAAGST